MLSRYQGAYYLAVIIWILSTCSFADGTETRFWKPAVASYVDPSAASPEDYRCAGRHGDEASANATRHKWHGADNHLFAWEGIANATRDKYHGADEHLFAWDLSESPTMNGLFPDMTRLPLHPLLSKVSFDPLRRDAPLNSIPTIFHNRSSLSSFNRMGNHDPILSLFAVDNMIGVLTKINRRHGSEYKVMKRFIRDGKEVMGRLPKNEYSIDEITKHFHQDGYSVLITHMGRRWNAIARFSRQMEEELSAVQVNAALYLTPEVSLEEESTKKNGVVRQGFVAHWDYVDVIIIQLAGRKRWSVSREPGVHLSMRDQQREPTEEEREHYAHHKQFSFTLCPGDVLFIPRGYIHNASTVAFDHLQRKWRDFDECPAYPRGVPEAESLAEQINMPSLHLTFGFGQVFTVAALVHRALQIYFADVGADGDGVAIPASTCSRTIHDLQWQSVAHHSLAEVARRETDCDNPSFRGLRKKNPRECSSVLRQSVPLLLLSHNEFIDGGAYEATKASAKLSHLKKAYLQAVDVFGSSASIPRTIDFVESHLLAPSKARDESFFHYPGYHPTDMILCPDQLGALSNRKFEDMVEDFVRHAEDLFLDALTHLNAEGREVRMQEHMQQDLELESVGQGRTEPIYA